MIKLELLYYPIPSPCLPSHPIFISAPALFCPSSPLVIYSLSQVLYSEPVLFSCMFFHLEDPCPLWLIQSSQSWDLGLYVCFYVALYTHHSIKHNEPCPQCCDHSYPPPPPSVPQRHVSNVYWLIGQFGTVQFRQWEPVCLLPGSFVCLVFQACYWVVFNTERPVEECDYDGPGGSYHTVYSTCSVIFRWSQPCWSGHHQSCWTVCSVFGETCHSIQTVARCCKRWCVLNAPLVWALYRQEDCPPGMGGGADWCHTFSPSIANSWF